MIGTVLTWLVRFAIVKVVALFGLGVLTFSGYVTLMAFLESEIQTAWGTLPADSLAYLSLAGFTAGFGIILSALSIRAAIIFSPKLGTLFGLSQI